MLVIHFQRSEKNQKMTEIHVNGKMWREYHRFVFKKELEFPERISTFEELEACFFTMELLAAKRFVFAKLSLRSYPSFELMDLMKKVSLSEKVIQEVMECCHKYGYIDDMLWIKGFVRNELRKKHGIGVIKYKLLQKKAPEEMIELAFEQENGDQEQKKQLIKLIQTKYRSRNLLDYKEREKTVGALFRRGYQMHLILEVFEELLHSDPIYDE